MIAGELPAVPEGTPAWLTLVIIGFAALAGGGTAGTLGVKLLDRRRTRIDSDEVFTRVAVTLVEPLRDRLQRTEALLVAEQEKGQTHRAQADKEIDRLRARVTDALTEADEAVAQAHRLRRVVQQWHRAIMDPAATIEWLRQLVGPDEPDT